MELSRNQQHYIIMVAIYNELTDFTYGEHQTNRSAEDIIASLCDCDIKDVPPFIIDSVMVSLSKYGEIKQAYAPYLKNWKWERLPLLTQAILLMSYTNFYFIEKTDKAVIINIAVELAKKYIDDKQAKFINGILDKGVLQ